MFTVSLTAKSLVEGLGINLHYKKSTIQAVARIADRIASQQRQGSHDVIGHVTIW